MTRPNHRPNGQQYLTDLGNAHRLVARHGQDLQYVPHWGKWLVWDETRWAVDETGELEQRAKETVLALLGEATTITDHHKSRSSLSMRCGRNPPRASGR